MKIDGKKVVDAHKPLLLEVTSNDVKNSKRKDASACAAAVACKRQLHVKDVRVHASMTYVDHGDKWVRYQTPADLKLEALAFDKGGVFDPHTFKLRPPSSAHKLGARPPRRTDPKKKRNTKSRPYHRIKNVRASQFDNVWKERVSK